MPKTYDGLCLRHICESHNWDFAQIRVKSTTFPMRLYPSAGRGLRPIHVYQSVFSNWYSRQNLCKLPDEFDWKIAVRRNRLPVPPCLPSAQADGRQVGVYRRKPSLLRRRASSGDKNVAKASLLAYTPSPHYPNTCNIPDPSSALEKWINLIRNYLCKF